LARREEAAEDALDNDRLARRGHALVVECEGSEPAWRRRVRRDVHVLRAVPERPEVVGLQEARSGVRSLGAVDAVELRRMPDRLVPLELRLLRVDDDGRDPRRALIGAQQGGRLLGDARRLTLERESLDVLPAGLRAGADVRARVAADLEEAVPDRHRV